ncbi:hypothetical protein ACP4OV_015107 [Aristida adscensionis]
MASLTRRSPFYAGGSCHLAVLLLALAAALGSTCRRCAAAAAAAALTADPAAESGAGGEPKWHVVSVSSLPPSTVCTASSSNSTALSVVHRHGPCSPLQPRGGGGAPPPRAEILRRDRARARAIQSKIVAGGVPSSKGVALPAYWGDQSLGVDNYIVKVGLGTPAREFLVELDTGSDLSWVQCKPCRGCYEQRDPLFDPARSSTFSAVPCAAPECQDLSSPNCSSTAGSKCPYTFFYADESQIGGNLVRDTLTLSPSETLPGFVFGCGHADTGLFGEADGLIGLARGKVSLASQAASEYGAGFSYCLPSSPSAAGYLSLGGGATAAPANVQFTAMVTSSLMPSLYYVDLVGIKVAGRPIKVPPAVFTARGTIVDSGTTISRLPQAAYAALRSAFRRAMGGYRRAPAVDSMDTCYDLTGHSSVQKPAVALVFADGATVSLDARGVMDVTTLSQVCLAFAPVDDNTYVGIIGNTQQKTFTMVYDVANQKIGFGANGCS